MIRRAGLLLLLLVGCRATTGRPSFVAFPEAETAELGFGLVNIPVTVTRLTDTLAAYLLRDSIPVTTVKAFDGFLDSGWFDAKTLKTAGPSLGEGVVRVRAFIDPGKPGYAHVNVETVYRPMADPSLPARELEAPVKLGHPVSARVVNILEKLKAKFGAPEDSTAAKKDGPPPTGPRASGAAKARADSVAKAKTDTTAKVKADTTAKVKADTTAKVKADTTAKATKRDTAAVKP